MRDPLEITDKQNLASLTKTAKTAPAWVHGLHPGELIRIVRQYLHMTQTQLARRSGVPQAKIARIESQQIDFRWSTLQRLLKALNADVLLLANPEIPWDDWLHERALQAAKRNVNRVLGTSALEAQQPSEDTRQAMVQKEKERLLQKRSSAELWNEP
jgi:transcriptional regulator with XRE-family HTH domain